MLSGMDFARKLRCNAAVFSVKLVRRATMRMNGFYRARVLHQNRGGRHAVFSGKLPLWGQN
jgi:hypothetical protein